MLSLYVRSYLSAYLGKAAPRRYVQGMQNWKWAQCKLVESPNNVSIPLNFLIVKVAVLLFL